MFTDAEKFSKILKLQQDIIDGLKDQIADLEHYIVEFCCHPVPKPREFYIKVPKLSDMGKIIERQAEKLRDVRPELL